MTASGERLALSLLDPWLESEARRHQGQRPPRFFTVGRLDVQSTGLILATNDGAWAQQVSHPSSGLTKEYIVTTSKTPSDDQIERIAKGGYLAEVTTTQSPTSSHQTPRSTSTSSKP